VKEADAAVMFPGGFGTHDEAYEVLTLVQTGKGRPLPIVFVDSPRGSYWKTWERYVHDHLLRAKLISPDDLSLFKVTTSIEEAVEEITGFYRVYHSSRLVGRDFVIRTTRPVPPALVQELSRDFADILAGSQIVQSPALPDEREQGPTRHAAAARVPLVHGRGGGSSADRSVESRLSVAGCSSSATLSEGNRDQVFTATPYVGLTDRGRRQARAAGEWIQCRYAPQAVVTSPFTRARQTTEIISGLLAVPTVVEEDLRERDYGALAGQGYASPRPGYDRERYWLWRPEMGETLEEVLVRVAAVLDRVAAGAPNGDVAVVSHGAVMMAAQRHVTGSWPPAGRVVRNAGIVVVEHRDGRYYRVHEVPGDEEGPLG
jgi:broad specificity phosphatase PhoE